MNELLTPSKIIKTNRKTLSLIINNEGDLIVRAPLKCKDSDIFDFINKKASWIIEKRTKALQSQFVPLKLINGDQIPILGQNYNIILSDNKSVKIENNNLLIPKVNSRHKLILFLKRKLKAVITDKINKINTVYNFKINSISISSAKTNWGSCSANNKIHFTYKLMLCPEQIVDYIIIHELVHTVIKNHSKNFWRNVKKIYPYYKDCENWLKENKGIVNII